MIKCRLRVDGSSAYVGGALGATVHGRDQLRFMIDQSHHNYKLLGNFLKAVYKDEDKGGASIGILAPITLGRIGTFKGLITHLSETQITIAMASPIKWEGGN